MSFWTEFAWLALSLTSSFWSTVISLSLWDSAGQCPGGTLLLPHLSCDLLVVVKVSPSSQHLLHHSFWNPCEQRCLTHLDQDIALVELHLVVSDQGIPAVELVHYISEVLRPLGAHDHGHLRCEIWNFVPVIAVTKQQVVPTKVNPTTEDDFSPDEKKTEDTILELLKSFTEGLDIPRSSAIAGCNPEQSAEAHSKNAKSSSVATDTMRDTLTSKLHENMSIIGSHPKGSHNLFTHYPKDPNCDVYRRTKSSRVRCHTKSKKRLSDIEQSANFGDLISTEHKIPSWFQDNSKEFVQTCQHLRWNHDTSTPHRSETSGTSERAVRRVTESRTVALVRKRSTWELVWLCEGKLLLLTWCARQNGRCPNNILKTLWKGIWRSHRSTRSIGWVSPITPNDMSKTHQFGKQTLEGIFIAQLLWAEDIWSDDLLMTNCQDSRELKTSEVHIKTFKGQVHVTISCKNFLVNGTISTLDSHH